MPYPLVKEPTYIPNITAPETLNPRNNNPDPFRGGSSGPVTQGRITGQQPGFTIPGIPVMAITAEVAATLAGPQPG
jgi:hypothetical protein